MAATNKQDLLAIHEKEYAKLLKLLATVDENTALLTAKDDEARIKDIVAHRAHWIRLFFTWYNEGRAGKDVQTPAPGYKWNQLKPFNAAIRAQYFDLGWEDAQDFLRRESSKLEEFIALADEAELYTLKLYPWLNNWTLGRWAEASGASAFRSAAKYIRKAIRDNSLDKHTRMTWLAQTQFTLPSRKSVS